MNGQLEQFSVAICIATYRRPRGLEALLASLDALQFTGVEPALTLVIVENCVKEPASDTLGDISALSRWPVLYISEPERGIVSARNRALISAPADVDYIAFVDDDETVSQGWMDAMLNTIKTTKATAVQGPVLPSYESPPPAWIDELKIFQLGPFIEGEQLDFAATNNSLIDATFLRKQNLRFDFQFNNSGGEDEELYGRLRNAGGTIRASAEAVVTDAVPTNRMTFRWVLRRQFRKGNTLGRIALLRRSGRIKRLAKAILANGYGVVLVLTLGFGSRARFFTGFFEIARGCGMIAAFGRIRFEEYSTGAVLSDRSSR
ncbi:MAG: glycosyltransferase [Rhodobacteraceae bacterium]|nr:glycosyltransferase [Paracoccaceae bacterium]